MNFVKNRTWYPRQKLVERTIDGMKCIDLTLPVGDYTEITGMILSYSPNAEPVSPPDFRDKWLQRVKETAERFLKDPS
ncbi:MAG TPA: WYL domain-containing protein [bacterium]|nr:WYL domain-containing protein [bacterium]